MTKKTSTKEAAAKKTSGAKKKTNLAGFAPKRADLAPSPNKPQNKLQADTLDAAAPVGRGPRGGRTANLADRAIAISFRVSKEQYKKLCEGRLDKLTTTQGLMLLALESYFRQEWGKAF
jgi:hypothetical protein